MSDAGINFSVLPSLFLFMEDQTDYKKLYEDEKKKTELLEKENALFSKDPLKRGYFSLVRISNQTIDILNEFKISTEIGNSPKDDKKYDRVKSLWEGLKPMLLDIKALRSEMKITTKDEEKEADETPFIETLAQTRK